MKNFKRILAMMLVLLMVVPMLVSCKGDKGGNDGPNGGGGELEINTVVPEDVTFPGETFTEGQRVKVYISEVNSETKGPFVTISRAHPGMVKRLFELEIPEIQDGTILIKGVTREPGSRSKIAVFSRDENVDAIGSCIGPKGARIAAVVEELRGEKLDVVQYSESPEEFVRAALSPATVNRVVLESERSCKVYVDADQLSLAIGKEGQNARLAARLTGLKIDIKVDADPGSENAEADQNK